MDQEKVNVILSMKGGLPHEGPFVTKDGGQANQVYKAYCKTLDLSTDNPHDGEGDVFWWEVEVGGKSEEVTPW